MEINKKGSVQQ